ncbi:16S rRNA (guanine(966)-N(2))-methyltransferase RsmD [Gordonia sp. SID5947]|uniref:16S rRNA (guanine(966)-N(2))-methyltransferase RsmD n=1 Tax=Gordonia sp. SID5947 TaxID=2690315 RepID=UPI00136D9976|nr:16S rRNA (guanine(966)-N(2))-methyltransferase RsmD [Gordonia sp. SID5947]MYR05956.1 16S rRNA (guanine(966)-N(2))-methyltransferase RsmD [Gordonia sp. SID5947]
MTRIIAGDSRGRRLSVPDNGTRPTSDRVREAVFNMISARFDLAGARVLDLYAGSGALAIEALSRGAEHATLVDSRRRATSVIGANLDACGKSGSAVVITRPVGSFLSAPPPGRFDLVFLDPPYDQANDEMASDLAAVGEAWLADDGVVVVERSARAPLTRWPAGMTVLVEKVYGDTRVEVAEHA